MELLVRLHSRKPFKELIMRRTLMSVCALLILAVSTPSQAQTLETAPANNGSGGVFLDLQPGAAALSFTGFDVPLGAAVGLAVSVDVWTRTGTYVGFTGSDVGWTLTQTIDSVSQGGATPAPFVLTTPIPLPAAAVTGIYLHAILPAAGSSGIRYTGVSATPPQTTWSNADLTLFSDTTRTGFAPFAGNQFSPRTFSGIIRYSIAETDTVFADDFEDSN
jgi:hypothetical protein